MPSEVYTIGTLGGVIAGLWLWVIVDIRRSR